MRILAFLLLFVALIIPFMSSAQQQEDEMVEFVTRDRIYDCVSEKAEIEKVLSAPQECRRDEDCVYFNYGYPFQPSACIKAIISKLDREITMQNLALVDEYQNICVNTEEEHRAKAELLNQQIEENNCNMIRLYCYKGYCRSKNYSVHSNDTPLRQLR